MEKPKFYKEKIENGPTILFEKRDIPGIAVK